MGAAAIPAIALVVVIGLVVCLCMGELAALLPHRTGRDAVLRLRELQAARASTTASHIGGVSGWGYWLGWFPVAPINMILAAGYIAVLFHVPLGKTVDPLGSLDDRLPGIGGQDLLDGQRRQRRGQPAPGRRAGRAVHPRAPGAGLDRPDHRYLDPDGHRQRLRVRRGLRPPGGGPLPRRATWPSGSRPRATAPTSSPPCGGPPR